MLVQKKFRLLLLYLIVGNFLSAQEPSALIDRLLKSPKTYIAYRASDSIVIDGRPDDKTWMNAHWTDYFQDIEGDIKPVPTWRTRAKMLWNEHYLYILAEMEEPHVWGTLDRHDQIIYNDNDFEVFIDPDRDTHHYYEIEVNPLNTVLDLYMNRPYRNGGKAGIKWNADGLRQAVHVLGTINSSNDLDTAWFVEMAIPFKSLDTLENGRAPKPGEIWNMNFSRVQWQIDPPTGEYKKKINPATGKFYPEDNWVWSPQGVINMHYPERWGLVLFSEKTQGNQREFPLPPDQCFRNELWRIYYRQKEFYAKEKSYTNKLSELSLTEHFTHNDHCEGRIQVSTSANRFLAILTSTGGEVWTIDQYGLIKKQNVNE